MSAEIYNSYLQLSRPYDLPEPWRHLGRENSAYRVPVSADVAWTTLTTKFSVEALLDAGLAQRSTKNKLGVHAYLKGSNVLVMPILNTSSEVTDLLTARGCVRGSQLPAMAILEDARTQEFLARSIHGLVLTDTLEDAIIARSLEIAAAPILGFGSLRAENLESLRTRFRVDSPAANPVSSSSAGDSQPELDRQGRVTGADLIDLKIANWTVAGPYFVHPPHVAVAISCLAKLRTHIGVPLDGIRVWTPSKKSCDGLEFALQLKDREWCRRALGRSLAADVCLLGDFGKKSIDRPPLAKAWRAVKEGQSGLTDRGINSHRSRFAWANYETAVDETIFRPLLLAAQSTEDPVERALYFQLAELASLSHQKTAAQLRETIEAPRQRGDADGQKDHGIMELTRLTDQMLGISKVLKQCKKTPKLRLFGAARPASKLTG